MRTVRRSRLWPLLLDGLALVNEAEAMSETLLLPGDLFFTHGDRWLSGKIRKLSRSGNESATWANHVGTVVAGGTIETALVSEAITSRVPPAHTLPSVYRGRPDLVCVWRSRNIAPSVLAEIVADTRGYEGRPYGWTKIILHAIPGMKRFARLDGWPICSWQAGQPFARRGFDFGLRPEEAQPDDMLDFCESHADKWAQVWPAAVPSLTTWAPIS